MPGPPNVVVREETSARANGCVAYGHGRRVPARCSGMLVESWKFERVVNNDYLASDFDHG